MYVCKEQHSVQKRKRKLYNRKKLNKTFVLLAVVRACVYAWVKGLVEIKKSVCQGNKSIMWDESRLVAAAFCEWDTKREKECVSFHFYKSPRHLVNFYKKSRSRHDKHLISHPYKALIIHNLLIRLIYFSWFFSRIPKYRLLRLMDVDAHPNMQLLNSATILSEIKYM